MTSKDNLYLRLKLFYKASDWLFIDRFKIKSGEEVWDSYNVKFDRDNGSGQIWEWIDFVPTEHNIDFIRFLIKNDNSIIRFIGSKYHNDFKIPMKQKKGLKTILDLYDDFTKT